MSITALDIRNDRVEVCTWDGRALEFAVCDHPAALDEKLRFDAAGHGTGRLVVRTNDEARLRRLLQEKDARIVGRDAIAPEVILARHFADRNRWERVLAVHASHDDAWFGRVEKGAACHIHGRWTADDARERGALSAWALRNHGAGPDLPLVISGPMGPELLANLLESSDCARAFMPDCAAVAGALGVLLSDWTCRLEERFAAPAAGDEQPARRFAALMDAACDWVAARGFDIDDASCHRFVSLARRIDGREETDDPAEMVEWDGTGRRDGAAGDITGVTLHVILETPMHALPAVVPFAIAPARRGPWNEDAGREPACVRAESLAAGKVVPGPAVIDGPFARVEVPSHWRATRTRAGGVLLERK